MVTGQEESSNDENLYLQADILQYINAIWWSFRLKSLTTWLFTRQLNQA